MSSTFSRLYLALALGCLHISPALAQEGMSEEGVLAEGDGLADDTEEDLDEGTITRKRLPTMDTESGEGEEEFDRPVRTTHKRQRDLEENRPYVNTVYIGADHLNLDPKFVHETREGLELIYLRDYKGAREHFDQMSLDWPQAAVGPVGKGLVWQSLMLENFDYKYEQQYEMAFREANARLDEAMRTAGNEAWEHFLKGGVLGVEAIHTMRKSNFVSALSKAVEAMREMKRCRELAPDFPDLQLAFGLYNYWRSVVTMSSKLLPDFEDKRAEGLAQMKVAESQGIFVAMPTTLALTFSYMEERDLKHALSCSLRLHRLYPDNVVNNIMLARQYSYARRYKAAEGVLNEILVTVPDNERAHYYLSVIYSRTKRLDEAIASMNTYLSFDLNDEYRATALYRQGGYLYRKKQYVEAVELYKEAWKVNRHKGAKRRMDRMKRLKKEGKISY